VSKLLDSHSDAQSGSENESNDAQSVDAKDANGETHECEPTLKSRNDNSMRSGSGTFPSGICDVNQPRKRKSDDGSRLETSADQRETFTPHVRLDNPPKYSVFLQVMLSVIVFSLCLWWSVPFIVICYGEVAESWTPVNPRKISFVIIGGYGDLAKKYLWQGVHNLDETYGGLPKTPLLLYSSGRAAPEVGETKTASALESGVFCASGDEVCAGRKSAFVERVRYRQLKTEQNFVDLCADISLTAQGNEEGRIFYLSVPPFTYPEIVKFIDLHCRPPKVPVAAEETDNAPSAWLRVVVEKPFGNDFRSAKELSQELLRHLNDDELYRIDHYLGKTTVRNIIPFRHANRGTGIESLLTRDHVEKVEMVVKETDGCKGRMNYYDEYGVVADMLQNHLTEVALMVAMDLPSDLNDLEEIEQKKLDALASIRPLQASSTVLGQYASYSLEAAQELPASSSSSSSSSSVSSPQRHVSDTPTFAATALHFDNNRWRGVPFILMTGKKLDERNNYLKVTFKDNLFCVPSDDDGVNEGHPCRRRTLIFHISHGLLKRPSILSSKSLPCPLPVSGWREQRTHGANLVHGVAKGSNFNVFSAADDEIAYSFLIRSVVKGQRHFFLSNDHLMASWKVWSPLMEALKDAKPKSYSHNKNQLQNLQFIYEKKGTLRFLYHHPETDVHQFAKYSEAANQPSSNFLGATLVTGDLVSLTSTLSARIKSLALRKISSNGQFHLALPGGNSPRELLRQLVTIEDFPWSQTHVWMVDERLVPFTSPHSNFAGVMRSLQAAPIPFLNLHPISTHLLPDISPEVIAKSYKREIETTIPGSTFDCIILGLGIDGHVASLFPHDLASDGLGGRAAAAADVIVTMKTFDKKTDDESNNRISLNYTILNQAESIIVVATGMGKRPIVEQLKMIPLEDRPLLPVDVLNKSKTDFFIDDVAWNANE